MESSVEEICGPEELDGNLVEVEREHMAVDRSYSAEAVVQIAAEIAGRREDCLQDTASWVAEGQNAQDEMMLFLGEEEQDKTVGAVPQLDCSILVLPLCNVLKGIR